MPTEIRHPSTRILAPAAADANSNNLTPLTIIAILIFLLHLAGAATVKRSQASLAVGPVAFSTADAAGCVAEAKPAERPLPFD
jgi:hypothetical protein